MRNDHQEDEHRRDLTPSDADRARDAVDQNDVAAADGEGDEPSFFSKWTLPMALFLLTCFTTLWAGAYQVYRGPARGPVDFLLANPESLWQGLPFAGALLFILVTHELGHYLLSRIHRVPASLPLFLPGPPHFIGTFGAVIRIRGPIMNRLALFDIGVAGPLAGFLVAVAALIVGLNLSTVVEGKAGFGLKLGEPLLLKFLAWLVIGPIPADSDVVLHPIGFAAWFGLFVTSLNLLPIGQLDGGHVAYALWGRRQRTMALLFLPVLFGLGMFGWPGWFLWAFMAGLWGIGHPPVMDPDTPLGPRRTLVGWIALAVFVLTFAPVPFSFH
ncbi:site-2 protease family protein [Candidatus Nitrospira inopinata]|jgi:membrane-associated protease RseP (regulator of RpoE activity)|uniref:Putative Peptidase M50 n=1 Tax=Candidatus Nitrospira inopinata TaxID=1715989 RepID=A0A0S4KTH8_9BACT|nr:site-2 protease family protein [Candidatus Nitrospira inopinata]CUQ66474.1 putative Peptidase M50 [Candidatus Nitrospira inopinata]